MKVIVGNQTPKIIVNQSGSIVSDLNSLTDVDTTGAVEDSILSYDATQSKFTPTNSITTNSVSVGNTTILDGSISSASGSFSISGSILSGLADPVSISDASTKQYVDNSINNVSPQSIGLAVGDGLALIGNEIRYSLASLTRG